MPRSILFLNLTCRFFKDIKWVITSSVAIVLWVVTSILWVKDTNKQKEEMQALKTENSTLKTKVTMLEGQVQGINQAAQIFMQNSPSENRFRIKQLEERVKDLESPNNNLPVEIVMDTTTVVRRER